MSKKRLNKRENFPNENFGQKYPITTEEKIYESYSAGGEDFPNENFGKPFSDNSSEMKVYDSWSADGKSADPAWLHAINPNWQKSNWQNAIGKKKITVKKIINKMGSDIHKVTEKAESDLKKAIKFASKFEPTMILNRNALRLAIEENIGAMAYKLYPAVANPEQIIASRIKPEYVAKSKSAYAKMLKMHDDLGGTDDYLIRAIRKGEKNSPISLSRFINGSRSEIDKYYLKNETKTEIKKGTFDWVGASDYGDKKDYYAGLHLRTPELSKVTVKVGDPVKITASNWKEMNGLKAKVLRINTAAGIVIIDAPAPKYDVQGIWEVDNVILQKTISGSSLTKPTTTLNIVSGGNVVSGGTIKLSADGFTNAYKGGYTSEVINTWDNYNDHNWLSPSDMFKNKGGYFNVVGTIAVVVAIVASLGTILKALGVTGETDEQIYTDPTMNDQVQAIIEEDKNGLDKTIAENQDLINKAEGVAADKGGGSASDTTAEMLTTNIKSLKSAVMNDTTMSAADKQATVAKLDAIAKKKKVILIGAGAGVLALGTILYFIFKK